MKDLFWLTVSCIKGVGSKSLLYLYEHYSYLTFDNYRKHLDSLDRKNLQKLITEENVTTAKAVAEELIRKHKEHDIEVIAISSELYPEYLRLIPDPPTVLYAKGNLDLLRSTLNLAVVGTREPTLIGIKSAQKIAKIFAEMGYTIVSGLALGVDTAGHEGALQAENGKTIAVMAGNLTEVYPAKNKGLAQEILDRNSLLLSETPIGQANMRGNFVKRDRIQSGLSLGVCPVQTPIKSGTQHTIEFSRKQKRFLFTPIPLVQDKEANAIQGNLALIEAGVPVLEDKSSYNVMHEAMLETQKKLIEEHEARFAEKAAPVIKQDETAPADDDTEQLNLFD